MLLRQPLGDTLWPQNRAQALMQQADAALARGHLSASDGTGARQLYEAAQAIDPDFSEPSSGLAKVAQAALRQADSDAAGNRFEQARQHLQLAQQLQVPRAQADVVAERLRSRESAHAGIDALVAQAEQARLDGRYLSVPGAPSGMVDALPLYQRILTLQPDRAEALRGREDALSAMLEQARDHMRAGRLEEAAQLIAVARDFDAGHVDLPDTEARFTEERDALRRRAAGDLAQGRIDRAVTGWRALLALDDSDADALRGLQQAALAHAARAQRLAGDFQFADAEQALRMATALAPDSPAVRDAAMHLERARRTQAQLAPRMPLAERKRRVADLLQKARTAEQRGQLLTPPGDSAYDNLRAALALSPRDPEVLRAVSRLLPAARQCFEAGMAANNLARARDCLDARSALGEGIADVSSGRRQLAQRWLDIGDERLGGGDLPGATAALRSARDMDPAAPGIDSFAQRLLAADR
ncbi:hypothetical protein ACYX7E_17440 [Luteimonas sp. RIT-PG2_3]